MHQNENIQKVIKLALSIKAKNKVKDITPVYELGNKLGLTEDEINFCLQYSDL